VSGAGSSSAGYALEDAARGSPRSPCPAVQAVPGQLDAARARITELEQENVALQARIRTLTALLAEWTSMPTARPT
jgi:hypothetical protein